MKAPAMGKQGLFDALGAKVAVERGKPHGHSGFGSELILEPNAALGDLAIPSGPRKSSPRTHGSDVRSFLFSIRATALRSRRVWQSNFR